MSKSFETRLRPTHPRCAYCHGPAPLEEVGVEACARCGTLLHSECVAADPVCPTIGCGPWRRGELPKPRLGPAQQLWRLAIETRNLAVLLAVIALIVVVVLLLFAHAVDRALPALPFF